MNFGKMVVVSLALISFHASAATKKRTRRVVRKPKVVKKVEAVQVLPDTTRKVVVTHATPDTHLTVLDNRIWKRRLSTTVNIRPRERHISFVVRDLIRKNVFCQGLYSLTLRSFVPNPDPSPELKFPVRGEWVPISPTHAFESIMISEGTCENNPHLKVKVTVTDNGQLEGNINEYPQILILEKRKVRFEFSASYPWYAFEAREHSGSYEFYTLNDPIF